MKAKFFTKETINEIGKVEKAYPKFNVGDRIAVSQWVQEGKTKRIQVFEGDVLSIKKNGASSTFRVRKIACGAIAVERIYPYYSPIIDSIEVKAIGIVRRAKLYYLRDKIGKDAKIKERKVKKIKVKVETPIEIAQ